MHLTDIKSSCLLSNLTSLNVPVESHYSNTPIHASSLQPTSASLIEEITHLHQQAMKEGNTLDRFSKLQEVLLKIKMVPVKQLPFHQLRFLATVVYDVAEAAKGNNYKGNTFNNYLFSIDLLMRGQKEKYVYDPAFTQKDKEQLLKTFAQAISIMPKSQRENFDHQWIPLMKDCVKFINNFTLDDAKETIQTFLKEIEQHKKKRSNALEDHLPVSKKLRLKQDQSPCDSWASTLKEIQQIEEDFEQKEKTHNPSFSEYQEAATKFSTLKTALMEQLRKNLHNPNAQIQLDAVEQLLQLVHPFPVNKEILKEELDLLQEIKQICTPLSKNKNHKKNATKWIEEIHSSYRPLLSYNYANLSNKNIQEKITELLENRSLDHSDEENSNSNSNSTSNSTEGFTSSLDWNQIFDLLKENIKDFETAAQTYQKLNDQPNRALCYSSIASAYEQLADYTFDRAKELLAEKKEDTLRQAISHYEQVKKYQSTDLIEIDLSILNSKCELAYHLKEVGKKEESLKEMRELRQQLKQHLSSQALCEEYPEVIFYELETLSEIYLATKNEKVRLKGLEKWKFFAKKFSSKQKTTGNQLEIFNWLENFAPVFQANPALYFSIEKQFKMAPTTDLQWRDKRKQQLMQGLDKLISHRFANKYGITLRPHQLEAMKQCQELIKAQETKGYFCLPTGAGKTILMLLILLAAEMPTLIVVPSTTLIEQTIENIQKLSPHTQVSRFDGLAKQRFVGQILVTTYDSLQMDAKLQHPRIDLSKFGLAWADEAHHSLTVVRAEIINKLQQSAAVFGLTATDFYNSKRNHGAFKYVEEVFGKKIFEISLLELIESKQLAPVKNILVHAPDLQLRGKKWQKKNQDADYTDAELAELINQEKFNSIPCDIYFNEYDPETKEALFGQSALFFCAGIAHAEAVCAMLNERGASRWKGEYPLAAYVHSKISPSERQRLIRLHKEGKIPILVGDRVFAEGYDHPDERIGFFLCPTKSIVFAKQSRGRLLRRTESKKHALIFEWCYRGLKQLLFREFVGGKAWVGINMPQQSAAQRPTVGYQVEWLPTPPKEPAIKLPFYSQPMPHFKPIQSTPPQKFTAQKFSPNAFFAIPPSPLDYPPPVYSHQPQQLSVPIPLPSKRTEENDSAFTELQEWLSKPLDLNPELISTIDVDSIVDSLSTPQPNQMMQNEKPIESIQNEYSKWNEYEKELAELKDLDPTLISEMDLEFAFASLTSRNN